MDRLKLKQLQALKLQKEQKQHQHKQALKSLIKSQQTLQIMLRYAQQYLKNNSIDNLSEYSPVHISRLVFDKQLEQIQKEFKKLPDKEAHISQFMAIMLKVMKFPFEKTPFFMVGLKEMFNQIAEQGCKVIKFQAFFKYILGQLVTMKEEEQNTEFQVRLIERKRQDYLLHDNGIKRIYYSKDLKMIFSLDERSNMIKLYDQDMKNIGRFVPKKQKHNNRFPIILDFDYSQITERLGVVLSDQTLSIVHLTNLLSKTQAEFDAYHMNEIVFPLPEKMNKIFFVQMMNKWLTVTEENNKIFLYDMDRIRTQPEKVQTRLKLNLNDQPFTTILEVVQLSCICLVAGNEVNFYNETFTQVKFKRFVHCQEIKHFKYSDQKNQFYLCGPQKNITIFSINRSGIPSRIWTFPTNKLITDFEVFPYFDTIVVADESNDIKLMHESTRAVYQQLSYSHIVKAKDKTLSLSKISKNQFSVYQTYMIVMTQEKIAIERDIQYSFLPYHYYDQEKEELYISVNHQIISFSLLSGQIRKNYSLQSSNLQKHYSMFIAPRCPLFILDHEFNIYEVYQNDELLEGQNKNYRKKINMEKVINCFYDEQLKTFIAVNQDSLCQVRNDKNNNFNVLNSINFEGFNKIISSTFCPQSKTITLLTQNQLIYQLKNYSPQIESCYKFVFPKNQAEHQDSLIVSMNYDSLYNIFILFSNQSEVYFVERHSQKQVYFNIIENMPPKLKALKFVACKYQLVKSKKGFPEPFILCHDDSGFLVQFSLQNIFEEHKITPKNEDTPIKPMFKDVQVVLNENIQIKEIPLQKQNRIKKTYQQIGLLKAHQKQIAIAMKVKVQVLTTLTVSIDGYIRLWNKKNVLLFSLKIPSLLKITWNMKQIETIKNKRSVEELLNIFKNNFQEILNEHATPAQNCSKIKKIKFKAQPLPINLKDPIKIEFESKDLEQLVMHKEDYRTFYSKDKGRTQSLFNTTSKVYPHPWRRKKQFVQIFQRASPPHKYNQKMPLNLLEMRTSLDMSQKVKLKPDYKQAQRILPQLTMYEPQRLWSERKRPEKFIQNDEEETFESCLYIKSQKKRKQINQFDEIDKEFKKKEMMMTGRKFVPKKKKQKMNSSAQIKSEVIGLASEFKVDPLKAIQRIFQQHNRECMQTKKGRMIRIPKMSLHRDLY